MDYIRDVKDAFMVTLLQCVDSILWQIACDSGMDFVTMSKVVSSAGQPLKYWHWTLLAPPLDSGNMNYNVFAHLLHHSHLTLSFSSISSIHPTLNHTYEITEMFENGGPMYVAKVPMVHDIIMTTYQPSLTKHDLSAHKYFSQSTITIYSFSVLCWKPLQFSLI